MKDNIVIASSLSFSEGKTSAKKRERMSKAQTDMLIAMWKECYKDLESTKQYSVWVKIKVEVDKLGKQKSIKQIKDNLWNQEDL